MKNLKRILSLALAGTMLCGMMVVGASAANFTDAGDIEHLEAVETMNALGVINGFTQPDGTVEFAPQDGLTRAQMATMIAIIANKGTVPTWAVKTTPTFADVAKGSWYEAAIEYCYNLGYINGYSATSFGPNDSLTATQAARMILNLLGYKATGTGDWQLETEVQARDENINLYDGLDDVVTNQPINRDNVAQMLYSALYAPVAGAEVTTSTVWTVSGIDFSTYADASKYVEDHAGDSLTVADITKGQVSSSELLGEKYLGLHNETTQFIAKVEADGKGTYTVTLGNGDKYTKVAEDYSALMGQKVNVMYKTSSSVYGITAIGSVVYEGTVGDYAAIYAAMAEGDTKENIGKAPIRAFNGDAISGAKISDNELTPEQSLKVVRNSSTSYVAVTVPTTLGEVRKLTSTTITLKGAASAKIDEEILGYEGIAEGDKVLVVDGANTVSGLTELAKAEVMTGVAADAYRTVNETTEQVRINGKWVTVLDCNYDNDTKGFDELKKMTKDTTYDLTMINGYVCGVSLAKAAEEAAKDLLILTAKADQKTTGLDVYYEARAYFLKDGTTAVIKLPADDSNEENNLYAYTEKNGIYTLSEVAPKNVGCTASTTDENTKVDKDDNTIDSTLIDEKAQVIILLKDGKVEVTDGKSVRAWDLSADFGAEGSLAFTKNVNGVAYVQFAFLVATTAENLPGVGASGNDFGYIVSIPYTTSKGVNFTIWNGEEEIEVTDVSETELAKGDFISYKTGDGVIEATKLDVKVGAVTGFNYTDKVLKLIAGEDDETKTLTIDDKTVYLYIDSANTKGQATGALDLADEDEETEGTYAPNVLYVLNGTTTDHVDVLVIDVRNALAGEENVGTPTEEEEVVNHTHTYTWAGDGEANATHTGTCTNQTGTCDASSVTHNATYADENAGTPCTGAEEGQTACTIAQVVADDN